MHSKHLVVIGGGAAGFFCAVNAARLDTALKVTIVEKSNKLLSKVKVSGGGRCNVTHACFNIADIIKYYPRGQHFLKKAFHWFAAGSIVEWFGQRGVKLKTEPDGRMFPVTDNSQTIINCLLQEAAKYNVNILLQTEITGITTSTEGFILNNNNNDGIIQADFVCIACGGYSKAIQFNWLKTLGHTVEEPVPSLFTFNMPGNAIIKLMGLSVQQALVKIAGTRLQQTGPLLITHWGLSGPAVLKLSAWAARDLAAREYKFSIIINWVPGFNEQEIRDEIVRMRSSSGAQKMITKNDFGLPYRLWVYLLEQCGIGEETRWADLPSKQQQKLIQTLTGQLLEVNGKTTFKEEFVTCGGIKLAEIDANTMQSKIVPRLFFAGEIMDVDGVTGGFNFQHAWTSGFIAAKTIAKMP
ncbi:MAG TPA: NAD(P)/FAD-dependent oxidoreductase [Chitinophagaceae bacterium]|nr:NAD(P)/FAD-dependent oxidoreductase [Chitinophagaceae bacterium]